MQTRIIHVTYSYIIVISWYAVGYAKYCTFKAVKCNFFYVL
jgi:hypothetical protein